MSREKSEFLSGFGTAFQIFKTIADAVLSEGGNDEDMRRVLSDKDLAKKIAGLIIEAGKKTENVFRVVVDYNRSLQEMIQVGKYDWVNNDITSDHFPIQGEGRKEVEITLFNFNRVISSDGAIAEMEKQGFRPARVEELLALGAAYPELQKQFPIVALGFVWRTPAGSRRVPCLGCAGGGRGLDLYWFGDDWGGRWRFAAARK